MADTARARPGTAGGITSPALSPDWWDARWKQARADAAADTALAIGGPEGHTASEWHSGRFRFTILGCDFVSSSAAAGRCCAYQSGDDSLTVPSGTMTLVPLNAEEFDTNNWHSVVTSTHKIVVDADGAYEMHGRFGWAAIGGTDPAIGWRRLRLNIDLPPGYTGDLPGWGAEDYRPAGAVTDNLTQEVWTQHMLPAGSAIYLQVQQNSGGSMTYSGSHFHAPRLAVVRIG